MQAVDPVAPISPSAGVPIANVFKHPDNATNTAALNSSYSSQENSTVAPGALSPGGVRLCHGDMDKSAGTFKQTFSGEDNSLSQETEPLAKSHYSEIGRGCGIAKSNSTTSARTAKSVPFIGAFPTGALRVHKVDEAPGISAGSNADPAAGDTKGRAPGMSSAAPPPPPPPMCLDNGDCFIIIGLPDRFTVGLDTIALTTSNGKEFRGFRDIPPGPHFLWMSEPGAISRCGYWFVSGEHGEVRVKQWDRYNEVLGDAASQVEVREQEQSIEETYPSLMPHNFQGDAASTIAAPPPPPKDGPRRGSNPDPDPDPEFTADNITIWRQLTSAITPAFLSRVTGRRTVTEWLVDTTDGAKGDIRFQEPTRLVKSIVGSQLDFLFQQDIIDLQLLNIAAGNQSNSDTTPRVLALLRSSGSTQNPTSSDDDTPSPRPITENDILAELQFIFLTGLHLGNYTCLEQWWHLLLKIIIRAHALVLSRPALVRHFLRTLHAQMVYNDRYIDHAAAAAAAASSTPGYSSGGGGEEEQPSTHSSILETIPRNKARLRDALTVYKRRLNQALLAEQSNLSAEQGAVGHAFADLEAWFWRYGWDLRSDYVEAAEEEEGVATRTTITVGGGSGGGRGGAAGFDDSDSEADDYAPVVVQLDEHGREVGLVSFND